MTGSVLDHSTLMGWLIPWILLGSVVVAGWSLLCSRRREPGDPLREAASTTTFFLVLFIVIVIGIVFTREATGPQHIMLLWPLPAVLAVCLLVTAMRASMRVPRLAAVVVIGVALTALVVTQVRTSVIYVDAYRSDRQWTAPWSPEIYAAARAVTRSAAGVSSIITADWGLGTQIFALGDETVRDRFLDPWPSFANPAATTTALRHEFFEGLKVIVVFHTQAAEIMPSTTQRVEVILKNLGTRVRPIFVGRQIEVEEVVS